MSSRVPFRKEIPFEQTWSAESVFPNDTAWSAEFEAVSKEVPSLAKFSGHLSDGPAALADWFAESEAIQYRAGKVTLYAGLRYAVDTTDQTAAALSDRARGLATRVASAVSFEEPELLSIGFEKLRSWTEVEPRLKIYRHYLDRLERRAAHVRSAEVQELLSMLNDPFQTASQTHRILTDADLKFAPARNDAGETFEMTLGSSGTLLNHADRTIRRTAFENHADAFLAFKNTMANCLAAGVKQDVFNARAARYSSSLEAALKPNYIPPEVFHSLIRTFRANLATWHRYWDMRKKALGYDTLYTYDEKAPLTSARPRVDYKQAVDWVCEGLRPLGEEYVTVARRGMTEDRWVDKYPNRGKRSGAFTNGTYGTHPFICMGFHNDLFSLSTLAHEMGHAMHNYYTQKRQPFIYRGYGRFLAETASNFNQAMVRAWLLDNPPSGTEESRRGFLITVIEEAMSNFHRYFLIMPTLARFELEIHERVERGEPLTAENMTDLLADLFTEVYGSGVIVDRERIGIIWAEFATHLYSNFYVFQYATGISGAHALAKNILDKKPNAVEKYLNFLSTGGSEFPLEALKQAGVDLTTPAPVETTFRIFADYVDRLKELTS